MLRGRKVTDPVVQGAAGGGYDSKPGLSKAWDSVGKAKSELRKVEQRLDEVGHPAPSLNQTGETSITEYGGLHWNNAIDNQTFSVPDEFASGAVVDNYGRSAYLRSKTHTSRKVSRLDGKYNEDKDGGHEKPVKPGHRAAQANHAGQSGKHKQTNIQLQEKKYSSDRQKPSKQLRDRHVEFSETVGVRENNVTYGAAAAAGRRVTEPTEQSTLTDSRDIRETEIRFLNNNLTRDLDSERGGENGRLGVGEELGGPRLTHVNVTVPSATRATSASSGYASAGSQKQGAGPGLQGLSAKHQQLLLDLDAQEMDGGRLSDCSSHSDSESGRRRRLKGDIRKIDPDGLAKIRETIQKQIKSKATENSDDVMGAEDDDTDDLDLAAADNDPRGGPGHRLHAAGEPIVPRSQELIEGAEKTTTPKVRKIAAGPAAPSYKGFSEAEVRYRMVDNKVPKSYDSSRKDKKRQVSLKLQDKRSDPVGTWLNIEDGDGRSKKVTRVIAPSRRPSKHQPQSKNKEIITTSSWRAGQELILRELGPVKSKKSSRSRERDNYSDGGRDSMGSPTMDDHRPDALGGDEPPYPGSLGASSTAAEIQQHRNLSAEARRVYKDLRLEEEEENDSGGDHEGGARRRKQHKQTSKRKAPKMTDLEKQQQAISAKQRHYDQEHASSSRKRRS